MRAVCSTLPAPAANAATSDLRAAELAELTNNGEASQAIEAVQSAIRMRPNWVFPRVNLGPAYMAIGKLDLAIATYKKAIELVGAGARIGLVSGSCRDGCLEFLVAMLHIQNLNYRPWP